MAFSSEKIAGLIHDFPQIKEFENYSLYFVRRDGLVLYNSQEKLGKNLEEAQSIGALLGGLWQASEALAGFIPDRENDDNPFRLSFDSSSKGLFISPISILNEDYFLSLIYHDLLNPAPLKMKLRSLKNYLIHREEELREKKQKEHYLFENITDEEMDCIFSTARN